MGYKQVIVVRRDLKMGKGKISAQVAHASLGAVKKVDNDIVEQWERDGGKKVVLKVDDIEGFEKIVKLVRSNNIPNYVVKDAGLTEIERGTTTCVGIGPAKEHEIDKVTKNLKLL